MRRRASAAPCPGGLRAAQGDAPGRDGLRYEDVDPADRRELPRALRDAVASGTDRPDRPRIVTVPKDGLQPERGVRRPSVPNVVDGVVQSAILTLIGPLVDRRLDQDVCGFRPDRDRTDALARAERLVGDGRTVCVAEDLRDAFDHVPRGRLRDVVAVPDDRLVDLICETCGPGRRGLPQGDPLSPALLNPYLARHLDRPWRAAHPDIPLLRYADDLLLLCRSRREALGTAVLGTETTSSPGPTSGARSAWIRAPVPEPTACPLRIEGERDLDRSGHLHAASAAR